MKCKNNVETTPSSSPFQQLFICSLCNAKMEISKINEHLLAVHAPEPIRCEVCECNVECRPTQVLAHFQNITHIMKVKKLMKD